MSAVTSSVIFNPRTGITPENSSLCRFDSGRFRAPNSAPFLPTYTPRPPPQFAPKSPLRIAPRLPNFGPPLPHSRSYVEVDFDELRPSLALPFVPFSSPCLRGPSGHHPVAKGPPHRRARLRPSCTAAAVHRRPGEFYPPFRPFLLPMSSWTFWTSPRGRRTSTSTSSSSTELHGCRRSSSSR